MLDAGHAAAHRLAPATIRDICRAALPGLIHFGSAHRLRVAVGGAIREISLSLPEDAVLHLTGLALETDGPLPPYEVEASSSADAAAAPPDLIAGRVLKTAAEPYPRWRCRFARPLRVEAATVRNRGGKWASRAYGLHVGWVAASGTGFVFDNLDPAVIRHRLLAQRGAWTALRARSASCAPALHHALDAVAVAALAHCDRTADALAEGDADAGDLCRARYDLLDAVCAAFAPQRTLPAGLAAALVPLLEALVWKGLDPPAAAAASEAAVLPVLFALELASAGVAPLARVQEFERLLQHEGDIEAFEAATEAAAGRLGLGAALSPLRLLPHGLRAAVLVREAAAYEASLRDVIALFAELGHAAAICHGTLLGAVRQGTFLAHDDDVDIALMTSCSTEAEARDLLRRLLARLTARGVAASMLDELMFLKVRSPAGGKLVDVFPVMTGEDGLARMSMRQMRIEAFPADIMAPLGAVRLNGAPVPAPARPELFLEARFGPGWATPDRFTKMPWIRRAPVAAAAAQSSR